MRLTVIALLGVLSILAFSCKKDDPTDVAKVYRRQVYTYQFNSGQVIGKPAYYNRRVRLDSMRATVVLQEQPLNQTLITVTLFNGPGGAVFPVGVHRVDSSYWGYSAGPDARVFAKQMATKGLGSAVTDSFRSRYSFDFLTEEYNGFFTVKDPVAPDPEYRIDTTSSAVFPVFGTFAR